jgi:hypothetical protein
VISALSNQKIKTKNSINKNREYTNRYQSDSPFLKKKNTESAKSSNYSSKNH